MTNDLKKQLMEKLPNKMFIPENAGHLSRTHAEGYNQAIEDILESLKNHE